MRRTSGIGAAAAVLTACIFGAALLLSLENCDFTTTVTAVITCFANVGPGLGAVGPAGNFAFFSGGGKLLLIFCMLLGRLELFPIIILLAPTTWRDN